MAEELVVTEAMRVQVAEQPTFASVWSSRTESSLPVEVGEAVVTREPRGLPVAD